MKEIDFLPDWYKTGRQRRIGYRTQYVGIIGVFVVMLLWSVVTGRSVSSAGAELSEMRTAQSAKVDAMQEYTRVRNELRRLARQAEILEDIDSKIAVSNVLGELSFLIDERIVLSKLAIKAESLDRGAKSRASSSTVKAVRDALRDKKRLSEADVRFKVLITGVAGDAGDVAQLIRKLEESPYFFEVIPKFCRNKTVKGYRASEFRISCYIANYIEKN